MNRAKFHFYGNQVFKGFGSGARGVHWHQHKGQIDTRDSIFHGKQSGCPPLPTLMNHHSGPSPDIWPGGSEPAHAPVNHPYTCRCGGSIQRRHTDRAFISNGRERNFRSLHKSFHLENFLKDKIHFITKLCWFGCS